MKQAYLHLEKVVKTYKDSAESFTALKNINMEIQQGEYISIIGKSGAGKTTLVNMITGVDSLTSGKVVGDDIEVHKLAESQRSLWRGRTIGIVLQSFQLIPNLTLLDNILLPMEFCELYTPGKSHKQALQLLEMVELEAHADKRPYEVSGGQQQRVAIARALVNNPAIIMADEPTGNLDTRSSDDVIALLVQLHQRGRTIVMVTHNEEIATHAERIIRFRDGTIESDEKVNTFSH